MRLTPRETPDLRSFSFTLGTSVSMMGEHSAHCFSSLRTSSSESFSNTSFARSRKVYREDSDGTDRGDLANPTGWGRYLGMIFLMVIRTRLRRSWWREKKTLSWIFLLWKRSTRPPRPFADSIDRTLVAFGMCHVAIRGFLKTATSSKDRKYDARWPERMWAAHKRLLKHEAATRFWKLLAQTAPPFMSVAVWGKMTFCKLESSSFRTTSSRKLLKAWCYDMSMDLFNFSSCICWASCKSPSSPTTGHFAGFFFYRDKTGLTRRKRKNADLCKRILLRWKNAETSALTWFLWWAALALMASQVGTVLSLDTLFFSRSFRAESGADEVPSFRLPSTEDALINHCSWYVIIYKLLDSIQKNCFLCLHRAFCWRKLDLQKVEKRSFANEKPGLCRIDW